MSRGIYQNKIDAFTCKDLRLAIQRCAVAKLRRDYVRRQPWPWKSAIDHSLRRRTLYPQEHLLQLIFGRPPQAELESSAAIKQGGQKETLALLPGDRNLLLAM